MRKNLKMISFMLGFLLLINVAVTPVNVEAKSITEITVTQVDEDTLKVIEDGEVSYLNRISETEIELITEGKTHKITNISGKLYIDYLYDSSVMRIEPSIKEVTMSMSELPVLPYAESWKTVGTLYWNNAARSLSASFFLSLAITALQIPNWASYSLAAISYAYSMFNKTETYYYSNAVQQKVGNIAEYRRYLSIWRYSYGASLVKSAYDYDYYIWY